MDFELGQTPPDATSNSTPANLRLIRLPDYDIPVFLASPRAPSESLQWTLFGGTAAFLGAVWTTIWIVAGA